MKIGLKPIFLKITTGVMKMIETVIAVYLGSLLLGGFWVAGKTIETKNLPIPVRIPKK